MKKAVLLIAFNRPYHTKIVFDEIKRAEPPRLYVAIDGPRLKYEIDSYNVNEVKKIVTNVTWNCSIKTLFRLENKGCREAVSEALNWFFEHEEDGIILEDDCLPSQSFFWFCEKMLDLYKHDKRVMSISGTNIYNKKLEYSYYFSNYALMWGWATWKDRWLKYDVNLTNWENDKIISVLKEKMRFNSIEIYKWSRLLNDTKKGIIDTWDYQWIYTCWINNGLTVNSSINLVKNLGFGLGATHTTGKDKKRDNLQNYEISRFLKNDPNIVSNKAANRYISKYWFHADLKWYLKYHFNKIKVKVYRIIFS